jgi:hypothetical protein
MAQHLDCEVNELDHANMTHGFDIELDFALYTKNPQEGQTKRKKKKKFDKNGNPIRKRVTTNGGLRESRDSSLRESNSKGMGKYRGESGIGRRDRDTTSASSNKSRARASHLNKAHISQTKFELNPPGFTDSYGNVIMVMNQSQRDYYKSLQMQNQGLG